MVPFLNFMTLNILPVSPNSSNSQVAKLILSFLDEAAADVSKDTSTVARGMGMVASSEHLQPSSDASPVTHDMAAAPAPIIDKETILIEDSVNDGDSHIAPMFWQMWGMSLL